MRHNMEDRDTPMLSKKRNTTAGCHRAGTLECKICPRQFDCVCLTALESMKRRTPRKSELIAL